MCHCCNFPLWTYYLVCIMQCSCSSPGEDSVCSTSDSYTITRGWRQGAMLRWLGPLVTSPEINMDALHEVCVTSEWQIPTKLPEHRVISESSIYMLWNQLWNVHTFIKCIHTQNINNNLCIIIYFNKNDWNTIIRRTMSDSRNTANSVYYKNA